MITKQTHRKHGWIARNLLLAGAAAFALSVGTSKASVQEDIIAYYIGFNDGITDPSQAVAAGKVILKLKAPAGQATSGPNGNVPAKILAATLDALESPNPLGTANKTTASAIAAYTNARLPQWVNLLAEAAATAALKPGVPVFGYKGATPEAIFASQYKDAMKIGDNAFTAGTKGYPKGTANTVYTGLLPGNINLFATDLTYKVMQGVQVNSTGPGGLNPAQQALAVTNLTSSLIKKGASLYAKNPLTPASVVTGLVAQWAGDKTTVAAGLVSSVITGAVKGASKYAVDIAQAAAYAMYGVYKATGGLLDPAAYLAAVAPSIISSVSNGMSQAAFNKIAFAVNNAIATGVAAAGVNFQILGASVVSTPGNPFAFNNGAQNPVTPVQN